jgi:hypothetical protein
VGLFPSIRNFIVGSRKYLEITINQSIILRLDIKVLQKDIEQLITELNERHLYISLLLIDSDEIANEYLVIGITEAELDKTIF